MIFVFVFLRVSDFLHKSFKSRVLATYKPLPLWVVSFADAKSQLWRLILLVPNPSPGGCLVWGLNRLLLREYWEFVISLLLVSPLWEVWILTRLHLCPSSSSQCVFSLIFLTVEGLFCWSSYCSQRIVLSITVVLPYLWEIVNSRSFHSAIFTLLLHKRHIILDCKSSLKYFKWMKTEYLIKLQHSWARN